MTNITVSQLNNYIKAVFEAEEMLHNVGVMGEISGLRGGSPSYFTLKDEGAAIPCTCYNPDILRGIKDGDRVTARGTVSYWNKAGKISFVVNKCEVAGMGNIALLFAQLQEKLKREGLFDAARKKPIPANVKRVGVVTSRHGAVIHDIQTVAWRRNPSVDIVLFDVRVQGAGAEDEIIGALNAWGLKPPAPPRQGGLGGIIPPDIIILARGGGSAEDLAPFNSERVARAVFSCDIPVITAVGHETDFTLVDFVSALRAPTPSAAAELCVAEVTSKRDRAVQLWHTLRAVVLRKADQLWTGAEWIKLKHAATSRLNALEARVNVASANIEARNPLAVLRRGFARPNVALETLKSGDEFEILYYNSNADEMKKGAATWKN